jgi:hypothetical protein
MRSARAEETGNDGMGPGTVVGRKWIEGGWSVLRAIDVAATTAGKLRCAIKEVRFRWRAALGSASAH